MDWKTLFGSTLNVKSNGTVTVTETDTVSLLEGKYVMIYFSAHWCPPCRGFTPALVQFYNDFKQNGNKPFELVFVSSDRDQNSFDEYYGEMPWAALPYAARDLKSKLSAKFKVSGIPSLIVLNMDGTLITAQGRNKVSEDPKGATFPWIPETFQQEFGTTFLGKSGSVDVSSFAGKFIGLYFSAHWCPPCRAFTPKLIKYYNQRREQGKDDLEIVFVSGDESEEQFNEYYAEMPWLAIPFGDPRLSKLNARFEVEGIPCFVILDSEGNLVNKSARSGIDSDPNGERFPYYPEPVEDLSQGVESYGCDINSVPSLLLFMENSDDDAQNGAKAVLASFGETYAKAKANTPEGPEMIFFYSFKSSRMSDQIRRLCQLKAAPQDSSPQLVLLDLSDNGAYYHLETEDITADVVGQFISNYKSKQLERKQLPRG